MEREKDKTTRKLVDWKVFGRWAEESLQREEQSKNTSIKVSLKDTQATLKEVQKMLPVIALLPQQGVWGGNIQITVQVIDGGMREGAKEGATFKDAGNPDKGVAIEMQKRIEDSKSIETEPEKVCPMVEQTLLNLVTNQHQIFSIIIVNGTRMIYKP